MNKGFWLLIILSMSCVPERPEGHLSEDTVYTISAATPPDTLSNGITPVPFTGDSVYNEMMDFETYYILAVAEGYDFDSLDRISRQVAEKLASEIDYMGRIYDPSKGIIVPYEDEDEIYRGEYYPRRFEENSVSIEMKYAFADSTERAGAGSKEMIVVAALFNDKNKADSVLNRIKPFFSSSKVNTRALYVGCMH